MNNDSFNTTMEQIVALIKEAGYDPYAQLNGYLVTGEDSYITRHGKARQTVVALDKDQMRHYIEETLRK